MPFTSSLRWSLYDRALALGPFLLGLLIAGIGLWIGAGAYLQEMAFGDPSDAGSPASTVIVVAAVAVGFLVWQIGRSAVRHHAMQVAIENRIDALVDEEHIASEAASKVDDRIADVETDVQQVSRKTTRLEQEMRGDELGEDALDTGPTSTGGAEPAEAAAAGTAAGAGASATAGDDVDPIGGGSGDATATDDSAASTGDGGETTESADSDVTESTAAASDTATSDTAAAETADSEATDSSATEQETATSDDATDDDDEGDADDGAASDDGFEWEDDTDDGEYYRNS